MQALQPEDCEFFRRVFTLFSGGSQAMTSEQLDLVLSSLGERLTPL